MGANHIYLPRIYISVFRKLGSLQNWLCELLHVFSVISQGKHAKGKPITSADLGFDAREFIIDMTTIMDGDHPVGKAWADGVTVCFGARQ